MDPKTSHGIINLCFLFALRGLTVTVLIFQTVTAQAPDFNMYLFSVAEIADSLRNLYAIQFRTAEIVDHTALSADKVMMDFGICVKADPLARRSQRAYQAVVKEHPERSIHCIQRNGGYPLAHSPVNSFSIGMIVRLKHLAQDLQTLMGHLQAAFPQDLLDMTHPFLHLLFLKIRPHRQAFS